jgi:hypothetical protein
MINVIFKAAETTIDIAFLTVEYNFRELMARTTHS